MKKLLLIAFSAVFAFILTACTNDNAPKIMSSQNDVSSLVASSEDEPVESLDLITFPAYTLDNPENMGYIENINNAPKFALKVDFPENWTIRESKGDETIPTGESYTPVFIYEAEKLIGYIGFNLFEPYTEEIEQENYYKTVYPSLRLSSMFHWDPYAAVVTTESSETGVVDIWYKDPNEIDNYPGAMASVPTFETTGILSYDKELKAFICIAFMPDTVDKAQATDIAKTISLSAAK